ncbi:ATP-binding protein [Maridesulfovibrio bastinii]|uniref:ATP-binding protein n=1 Tax=Maridesulfovibrio bastinii TaxID=47157 RepID=UPI0003FA27B2|nr:ATP-binding protein [Maridesulfovibrio bastinii]
MIRLKGMSLKNKFFFSTLGVILTISVIIAFLARWILVSSLTSELKLRGVSIAHSVAERGTGDVLDNNPAHLLSLLYDEAKLRERQHLIAYIFVLDRDDHVLSHTFTVPFPHGLAIANPVSAESDQSVRMIDFGKQSAYDIGVPVKEGLYRIGTVHVGLNKTHIDELVGKLRVTFLGFISIVIVILFIVSHRMAEYITRPISKLTSISDKLSKGNFEVSLDQLEEFEGWNVSDCPVYTNTDLPCWHLDRPGDYYLSDCKNFPDHDCCDCSFYVKRDGDEVVQLGDSFRNMVWSIKLYRRRLRESEEKYRSLFNSGPDPVLVVDCAEFTILDANPRAKELYGYSRDEFIGIPFLKLGPDSNAACIKAFEEYGESSESVYYPKILHYKKGGDPFYVNMHVCPITYRGTPAIIIGVTDITQIIEKDAQLVQAAKMKSLGEMSAGVAHEVNQPLNAIKMGSEYLSLMVEMGREIPPEQLDKVVSEISRQVDRAAEIIDTLRSFSRKSGMLTEEVDINTPVKSVLALITRQFELQNITINLDLDDNLPPVTAQDNRLQQVFFNILNNARDSILEKSEDKKYDGIVEISTYADSNYVYSSFKDNGTGISKDVLDKIFEPFFSTKEVGHGMGLGLAITYGIVEDYKGRIDISSEYGEGTTFIVSFPRIVAEADCIKEN